MSNGSEQIPEGVRIPRPGEYPADPAQIRIDAIRADQDDYHARIRSKAWAALLRAQGYDATARHDGVLLTEDAARAVLARLEED